jgi:hypothetical protein
LNKLFCVFFLIFSSFCGNEETKKKRGSQTTKREKKDNKQTNEQKKNQLTCEKKINIWHESREQFFLYFQKTCAHNDQQSVGFMMAYRVICARKVNLRIASHRVRRLFSSFVCTPNNGRPVNRTVCWQQQHHSGGKE